MRFLVDFFKWLFYGAAANDSTAADTSTLQSSVPSEREEPIAPKKPDMKVVDLRILASPDDFLEELRSVRLGNDYIRDAREDLLAELRRLAAMSRRDRRKDAA